MKKILLFLFGLFIIVGWVISACQSADPQITIKPDSELTPTEILPVPNTPTPTSTEKVIQGTVSIWHSWDESHLPTLVQIINNFQTSYPDVLFDVRYVPIGDLLPRYEAETRDGSGPTLLFGPAEWGPDLFEDGLVTNLTDYFNNGLLDTLNQPMLNENLIEGILIGIPFSLKGVVLFRNEDIITISPNSFEDLMTIAQASTQGENVGAMLERSFFYSGAHLEGLGGKLMDEHALPAFNNEKGVMWLELLDLFDLAGPTNYFSDQDLDYFKEGKIGWIIDGTWNLQTLAEAVGPENLAIDEWPSFKDGKLAGYIQSENIFLSPYVEGNHLHASVEFMRYLISPEAQSSLTEIGLIPSVVNVPMDESIYGPIVNQAILALSGGVAYPLSSEISTYNIHMDVALRSFFDGLVTPQDALQKAHNDISIDLGSIEPTPTP